MMILLESFTSQALRIYSISTVQFDQDFLIQTSSPHLWLLKKIMMQSFQSSKIKYLVSEIIRSLIGNFPCIPSDCNTLASNKHFLWCNIQIYIKKCACWETKTSLMIWSITRALQSVKRYWSNAWSTTGNWSSKLVMKSGNISHGGIIWNHRYNYIVYFFFEFVTNRRIKTTKWLG